MEREGGGPEGEYLFDMRGGAQRRPRMNVDELSFRREREHNSVGFGHLLFRNRQLASVNGNFSTAKAFIHINKFINSEERRKYY